jgi:hypothetical protein
MFIESGSFLYAMTGFLLGYLCGFKKTTHIVEPPALSEATDYISVPPSYASSYAPTNNKE